MLCEAVRDHLALENGYVLFKGKCYSPAFDSPKKPLPTSSPPEAR